MSHLGRAFLAPGTLSTPAGASIQAPCGRTDRTDRTGRTFGQSGGAFQSAMAGAVAASALVALQKLGLRSSSGVQRRAFSAAKSLRHQPLKQRASLTGRMAATVLAPPGELLGVAPDEKYNVPAGVREKLGKDLLLNPKHPLGILWRTVQDYFAEQDPNCKFFDTEKPVVNTVDCFDKLRVPPEHPSRSPSDTYYVNKDYVLRTHTSAHQCQFLSQYPKITSFLCAGDVYRRDEIDASHYPAFHQCEGVRLFDAEKVSREEVLEDLKKTLEGLAAHLFQLKTGEDTMRWLDEYFPFTEPSLELEIFYQDDWMEVLGCGVRPSVYQSRPKLCVSLSRVLPLGQGHSPRCLQLSFGKIVHLVFRCGQLSCDSVRCFAVQI